MSWSTPAIYTVGQVLTAALMNNVSGDLSDLDSRTNVSSALTTTSQGTTATTYGDLATVGPTVTITTGTTAIVSVAAEIQQANANDYAFMSFAISGATTAGALDSSAAYLKASAAAGIFRASAVTLIAGLTAGSNTFTAKYRSNSGGTASFLNRVLIAWPGNKLS